jgi:hypothetical protein
MNEFLAQYFGTAPVAEETTKQASADLFVKLAQENGIDLQAMSDQEVQELYDSTMGKHAESEKEEKKEEEDKKEMAAKEHEEKKAAAEEAEAKLASMMEEGTLMGQIIAHSFDAELDKIAAAKEAGVKEHAGKAWSAVKGVAGKAGEKGLEAAKHLPGGKDISAAHTVLKRLPKNPEAGSLDDELRRHAKKHMLIGAGKATGAAAGVGTGAAVVHHFTKSKEASALEELAAQMAVEKVAEAGFDRDEAVGRLGAVLTLGVDDTNSKVAQVQTVDQAIEVRSLELAEAASYPVNWPTE